MRMEHPLSYEKHLDPFSFATDWQFAVLQDRRRFVVAAGARRGGKTMLAALRLWLGAETRPGVYFCIAPSREMAMLCWEHLGAVVPYPCQVRPPRPCVHLPNGSKIYFASEEAVLGGCCRGWQLDGVVIDEFFSCRRKDALAEVLLPALSDRGGWALVTGTPSWARPAMRRLRLSLRIAAKRAGFDLSNAGVYT